MKWNFILSIILLVFLGISLGLYTFNNPIYLDEARNYPCKLWGKDCCDLEFNSTDYEGIYPGSTNYRRICE